MLITPKGSRVIISPSSTPAVDMMTDVRMMTGFTTELNWLIRMRPMSISAVRNAPPRKSMASVWSCD